MQKSPAQPGRHEHSPSSGWQLGHPLSTQSLQSRRWVHRERALRMMRGTKGGYIAYLWLCWG